MVEGYRDKGSMGERSRDKATLREGVQRQGNYKRRGGVQQRNYGGGVQGPGNYGREVQRQRSYG